MKNRRIVVVIALALGLLSFGVGYASLQTTTANIAISPTTTYSNTITADSPISPTTPVKLIFIHHSTGENWLNDSDGGLGIALRDNNYFVSDTNYGWGPDDADVGYSTIGDHTDIGNWYNWFAGPNAITYTTALYAEYDQNSSYSRLATDPGGPNEIIMFKSCYPNSHIGGNPGDPPTAGVNPLRGQDAYSEYHTVANIKGIYNDLLTYFANHQEKLFVVITAPPLQQSDTDAAHATNARAVNNWLLNDWLDAYPYNNVAVFDFYNVLTSDGGSTRINDPDTNDLDWVDGNHHRWIDASVQHTQTVANNYSAYWGGTGGGSHPSTAGNLKATAEFVPLLNVFYNRWQGGTTPTPPVLHLTQPDGGENWLAGSEQTIQWTTTGTVANVNLTYSTDSFATRHDIALNLSNTGSYTWSTPVTTSTTTLVRVESVVSPTTVFDVSDAFFTLYQSGEMDEFIYLPLALRNHGETTSPTGALVQPGDLTYLGAFRLPDVGERPLTFEYGGNAMTFNPDHGTLFIMGHDRLGYGELPDGNQVAEVNVPVPVNSRDLEDLNDASLRQGFTDVLAGHFLGPYEIVRMGMTYLNHPATGPKLHLAFGWHLPPDNPPPTHAWINADFSDVGFQGEWHIGTEDFNSVNGYMFNIPTAWADTHTQGRYLATGRYRDGGWGGMGPSLYAYTPWLSGGTAPVSGTHLAETVLLRYQSSTTTNDIVNALDNYQHADEWEGADWITTSSGKSAAVLVGTKGTGAKYWYGWVHPDGPELPCVEVELLGNFTLCRLADGTPCGAEDLTGCTGHNDYRGWWSSRWDAQFIFYDPADLAQVAAGALEPWQPQPYAVLDVDEYLYLDPAEWDQEPLGLGDQRRSRLGAAAYDPATGTLYVLELYADGGKPVVHVWHVQ